MVKISYKVEYEDAVRLVAIYDKMLTQTELMVALACAKGVTVEQIYINSRATQRKWEQKFQELKPK